MRELTFSKRLYEKLLWGKNHTPNSDCQPSPTQAVASAESISGTPVSGTPIPALDIPFRITHLTLEILETPPGPVPTPLQKGKSSALESGRVPESGESGESGRGAESGRAERPAAASLGEKAKGIGALQVASPFLNATIARTGVPRS